MAMYIDRRETLKVSENSKNILKTLKEDLNVKTYNQVISILNDYYRNNKK